MYSPDKRGKRLLQDLNNAFKRDGNIDEFDYIPVLEPKNNCSPVVLVDHKLGVELWSVRILFQFAYHALMDWRDKNTCSFTEPKEVCFLSRAVVLFNPECYTAWNIRKELVETGEVALGDDLKLSALVLTKHPKSSETFCHRRWLLGRYIDNHLQSSQGSNMSTGSGRDGFVCMDAIDLNLDLQQNNQAAQNGEAMESPQDYHAQIRTELHICTCAADRYPCNYYAWSHRLWVVQHAYNCSIQILLGELQRTECWVNKHISDTCGYNYRQFLLTSLGTQRETLHVQMSISYLSLLEKEHRFTSDLISTFQGHEAMWCHRKYVFHSLHSLYIQSSSCGSPDAAGAGIQQKKTRLELDPTALQYREINSVQTHELKASNSTQKFFAQNYIDWMQKAVIK
ncbi:PTR1B-like protein [Mya arenaria]|uniref:PTR1B-like protein n=1 Tax=Mya arenaria TaxID=6604 RepID=A0ABY7DSV0_MYAAR|nr:protein prenyltransferase alpha subunit repeat-containing protein 1-B-like [Mya arenaria]WAR00787.1 PTR1B-like protein [Mya arenaria]